MTCYAYRCPNCQLEFEEQHEMGLAPEFADCPQCYSQSRRLLPTPYIAFKGKGWTRGRAAQDDAIPTEDAPIS